MILPNTDQLSGHATSNPVVSFVRAEVDAEREALTALVRRAQAEDPAAQTELVQRFSRRLGGFIRTIVRQSDAVEDLIQTVFIKMFRRLGRLRDPAVFESWIFTLARNTALDHLRRCRCRPVTVATDELHEFVDTNDRTIVTNEIYEALGIALNQLPRRDRALVHHLVQGTSYRDIAEREGMTVSNVKIRLHRMRPFLRRCVGGLTETRKPDPKTVRALPRAA